MFQYNWIFSTFCFISYLIVLLPVHLMDNFRDIIWSLKWIIYLFYLLTSLLILILILILISIILKTCLNIAILLLSVIHNFTQFHIFSITFYISFNFLEYLLTIILFEFFPLLVFLYFLIYYYLIQIFSIFLFSF
jgi:hypothetical protein